MPAGASTSCFAFFVVVLLIFPPAISAQDATIEKVIKNMTLKQKIGQMVMGDIGKFIGPADGDSAAYQDGIQEFGIGFLYQTIGRTCANSIKMSQSIFDNLSVKIKSGGGPTIATIPVALALDSVRGTSFIYDATAFPHNIGLAATWNLDLARQQAEITARDLAICGWHVALAPAVDNGNQPLWGRHYETFGSQPLAAAAFGAALVKGLQKPPATNQSDIIPTVASCLKHWLGYGLPDSGLDRTDATFQPLNDLLSRVTLPPFRNVLSEGSPLLMMINSGRLNNIPLHASQQLVRQLLMNQLGFSGVILSDYDDFLRILTRHNFVNTYSEAFKMALDAGLDVHLTSNYVPFTMDLLYEMVTNGTVSESRIDQSVRKILQLKARLGLLDSSARALRTGFADRIFETRSTQSRDVAKQIAEQSITLLQNRDSLLPLRLLPASATRKRILVVGPAGNDMSAQCGGWLYAWKGLGFAPAAKLDYQTPVTLYRGIQEYASAVGWQVDFEEGTGMKKKNDTLLSQALVTAASADLIVVAVGEPAHSEGGDPITSLSLPPNHVDLIQKMSQFGKKLIVVIISGRPRLIHPFAQIVDAIIYAYLPCFSGGNAIARVIFGDLNPSGRLPFPYPQFSASQRLEMDTNAPWLPFGYGLSYTEFSYSRLSIFPQVFDYSSSANLIISIDIFNNGSRAGDETVFLRISEPLVDSETPRTWTVLKRFRKITNMLPSSGVRVTFTLRGTDFRHFLSNVARIESWVRVDVGTQSGYFLFRVPFGPVFPFDMMTPDDSANLQGTVQELNVTTAPGPSPLPPIPTPQIAPLPVDEAPHATPAPDVAPFALPPDEPNPSPKPLTGGAIGGYEMQLILIGVITLFVIIIS